MGQSNAPGELRPTDHNPKSNPKACAVCHQLTGVVRRVRIPLATTPLHARSGVSRQWVTREEAGQPCRHAQRVDEL
jgi:hypothetical protein